MGLYDYSVGRGCNLLLNVGPDRRGLLPDLDAQRLRELGQALRRRFGHPLIDLSAFTSDGATWTVLFDEPVQVDHVVIQEDLRGGEHIRRFEIEVLLSSSARAGIKVHGGESVGHKAICHFPLVSARGLRFRVTEADGAVRLQALNVYSA